MSVTSTERPRFPSRRLSVSDYRRMADAGIFAPHERLELIEGQLLEMAPIGTRHAATTDKLNREFGRRVADTAIVRVQNPLLLAPDSEVQPDLMLLEPREDFYAGSHPVAADVLLLIEVADASRRYDRDVKLPLYARHRVAEVWLIDLEEGCLEIHRTPAADGYRLVLHPDIDEQIAPERLPACALRVGELFPPPTMPSTPGL